MSFLNTSENMKKRSKQELKIEQKRMIIEYHQKNPKLKQVELIEHFNKLFRVNIPRTTMSGILSESSRKKILKQNVVDTMSKRIRQSKYPEMENMLNAWCKNELDKGVTISDAMIVDKAKEIGVMLNIVEMKSSFNYSHGWLQRFKRRFHVSNHENEMFSKNFCLNI
jgi:competence CoiA-like predicted nuclease